MVNSLRIGLVCVVLGSIVGTLPGQVSPDEAMAKLKARQEARDAERAKPANITQGQLDDLHAEIARLRAEVATLKAASTSTASPRIDVIRQLAIGQTRDQLMDFVRRHPNDYELVSDKILTPPTGATGGEKTESVVLARKEQQTVEVGTHPKFNGVNVTTVRDVKELWITVEKITISIEAGQITALERSRVPPPPLRSYIHGH